MNAFLRNELIWVAFDHFLDGRSRQTAELRRQQSAAAARDQRSRCERAPYDELIEARQHVLAFGAIAAPPCRNAWDLQIFTEHLSRQARQEAHDGFVLDDAAADGIGDHDFVLPRRLQQAGDTDIGIDAQLQRVALIRLDASQNQLNRFEPLEKLLNNLTI